jgi:hypothetical protein
MAKTEPINIKINLDSKDAQQGVDKLQEGVKQTGDAAKKAEAGAKKAGGAFASIGNALKSLGIIGLVVRGFEFLQEVLMKNQKVADAFAVAGEFISRVLSDLVEFVVNNFGKVVDLFTKVFNDPMKYVKELGEAIKNNLIERVKSLIDAYGFLGEIIKNVFTGEFDKAAEAAKNFGKEVVDVFTGVDDAFDKGVEVVKNATSAIVEYGKQTLEAAKTGVALRNSAKLAASEAEVAAAKFKRQAEEQRQIRDNEFASLEDRIAANQRLGKILEQQLKQEERAAELAVSAAQYELNKNKTLDNQIALNQALAALEGKREEITGQRSEQLVNEIALTKELQELNKTRIAAENKLDIDARKAAADRIKDEKERLEVKRQIAVDEAAIELKRLEDNVNAATEGTTARVAAEIEYKEKKAAIANEIIAIDDQISKLAFDRELERIDLQLKSAEALNTTIAEELEIKRAAYDAEQVLLDEALANNLISEKEYTDKSRALSEARTAIDEKEKQNRIDIAREVAQGLSDLSNLVGQQTAAGKALAIASATITTYLTAIEAYKRGMVLGGPILAAANAAIAAAVGIANIRKIVAVKVPGASSSGGTPAAPSVNSGAAPIQPQPALPTVTQLDNQTINRMGSATNRAYVLESDINNNQERLIRITRAARLG